MNPITLMDKFLLSLGCRRRGTDYILDGFSGEFYLRFDAAEDTDQPDLNGTVDIHVVPPGLLPHEGIRVATNCARHKVMRFMFALGVDRFRGETRKFLYESNSVIRTQ